MACPCKYYDDYYDDGAYDDHANDDGDDQVTFACPARAYELCLSPAPQFTICHAHHNLAHSKQLYHCCSTRTHWHWSSCTPQADHTAAPAVARVQVPCNTNITSTSDEHE